LLSRLAGFGRNQVVRETLVQLIRELDRNLECALH
jgi:hypothetical protein